MADNLDAYGFTAEDQEQMQACFKRCPEIEKIVLFGSRAMNTFRSASDVDLVIYGKAVNRQTVLNLKNELEDTNIPYFFDVINAHTIDSPELLEHLRRHGKLLYKKGSYLGKEVSKWLSETRENGYLKRLIADSEIDEGSAIKKYLITATDGKNYRTNHYDLQAIISVGFKVENERAVQFRKWARPRKRESATIIVDLD